MNYKELIEEKSAELRILIEKERKDQNLTIKELSYMAGITQQSYLNFRDRDLNLGYKTFLKLLLILDIEI